MAEKLKTLRDVEIYKQIVKESECKECRNFISSRDWSIIRNVLKQEAIKWIKALQKIYKESKNPKEAMKKANKLFPIPNGWIFCFEESVFYELEAVWYFLRWAFNIEDSDLN